MSRNLTLTFTDYWITEPFEIKAQMEVDFRCDDDGCGISRIILRAINKKAEPVVLPIGWLSEDQRIWLQDQANAEASAWWNRVPHEA